MKTTKIENMSKAEAYKGLRDLENAYRVANQSANTRSAGFRDAALRRNRAKYEVRIAVLEHTCERCNTRTPYKIGFGGLCRDCLRADLGVQS